MTTNGTNTENQESLEIGQYESPEKLAIALEAKSKQSIAEKIRKIASEVQGNSISLRQKLQEELTQEEQTEIRKELPGTGVEEVFNKGLTVQERAEEMALKEASKFLPGGEETIKKIGKLETWWNSISDAWDKASSLFSEGKIAAAIGVIFAGLFGRFNLKDWEKKESSTNKEEEVGKAPSNNQNELDQSESLDKYHFGIAAFLKLKRDTNNNEYLILNSPEIKDKSYNALGIDNLEKNGLSDKVGFKDIQNKTENDKNIYNSLLLIKEKEKIIDTILKEKKPDWKNELTIKEIFENIFEEIKFYKNFENIDLSKFDINEFNIGFLDFENPKNGDLNNKIEILQQPGGKLDGVSINFLSKLYLDNSNNKKTNYNYSTLLKNSNTEAEQKEKDFLDDFIKFGNDFIEVIKKDFYLGPNDEGIKKDFGDFFDNKGLTTKTILEFYIITGGNLNNYNDIQKSMIYFKVFKLLGEDSSLRGKTYDSQMLDIIKSGFTTGIDKIPQSFIDILKNIMLNTFTEISKYLKDGLLEIYNALSWKSLVAILFSSGLLLLFLSKLKIVRSTIWGVAIGIIMIKVLELANIGDSKSIAQKTMKNLKEDNPKKYDELITRYGNEDKFEKKLTDDIENPIKQGLQERLEETQEAD